MGTVAFSIKLSRIFNGYFSSGSVVIKLLVILS